MDIVLSDGFTVSENTINQKAEAVIKKLCDELPEIAHRTDIVALILDRSIDLLNTKKFVL